MTSKLLSLVSTYLVHNAFSKTAEAFNGYTNQTFNEDLASIKTRQSSYIYHLKDFNAEQTAEYDQLINGVSNDWDIFYWATDTKPTPPQFDTEIMRLLKEHVKNHEKVQRIRQPDL